MLQRNLTQKQSEQSALDWYQEISEKKAAGQPLTEHESAFLYLWQSTASLEKAFKRLANRKSVIVPSDDCRDYIERYGMMVDRELDVLQVLKSHGFTGEYPSDLNHFLSELTSAVPQTP